MNLLAPVPWVKLGALGALLLAVFYVGWRVGRVDVDRLRAAQAQELARASAAIVKQENRYENQLRLAAEVAVDHQRIIADLRAQPHVRLRCSTADSSPLPDLPGPAAPGTAGAGALPPGSGSGAHTADIRAFDPAERIYALADDADTIVEACRLAISQWPR